jgi:FkbM family methyltransferase
MMRLAYRIARKCLKILLPETKHIPINYWFDVRMGGENELRHVSKIGPNKGTALDIGANAGLFAYALSKSYDKVIAFEINPDMSRKLQQANLPKVEVIDKGLSSEAGTLTLYIPIQNGRELDGWASVLPDNLPNAERVIEKTVEVITLDSLQIPNVSFIKMDVEGHEVAVLEGAEQTLRAHKPVLLMEIREANQETIFNFLGNLGYKKATLEERAGVEGADYNFIFVPS